MAEYIDRDAALLAISYYPIENPEPGDIIPAVLETARKAIARIDTADVAPVRNGRWMCIDTDTEQFFLCNRCKKKEYWESDY